MRTLTFREALGIPGAIGAYLKAPGTEQAAVVNKVSFVFNFFDELRREVPTGK